MRVIMIILLTIFLPVGALSLVNLAFSQPIQLSPLEDSDNDGLLNGWEVNGIDLSNDGVIDLDLKSLGADPLHKDIFMEIDYMQFHKPIDTAIQLVVDAFRNASIINPDGSKGINLHVIVDEEIPHQNTISWISDFIPIKNKYFGTELERQTQLEKLNAKKNLFHYVIFGHAYNERYGSSGVADRPGLDLMVTLGENANPSGIQWAIDPVTNHKTGNIIQQSGTLMHELGHNLGLQHGGNNSQEYNPNYISIMGYGFQTGSLVPHRALDYSRCNMDTLNEYNLNETKGFRTGCPIHSFTYIISKPGSEADEVKTDTPIDFDKDGKNNKTGLSLDINCKSGLFCSKDTLKGFDDWSNIQLSVPSFMAGFTGSEEKKIMDEELTANDVYDHQRLLLNSLYNSISNISITSFNNSNFGEGSDPYMQFRNLLVNPNSTQSVFYNINTNTTEGINKAVMTLENLKSQVSLTSGEGGLIVDPEIQQKVETKIEVLIESLENQHSYP